MMALEVERKYLLPEAPAWLGDHPHIEIAQGYLAITESIEVRIRRAGADYYLTAKLGHGEVREEAEIALSEDQFDDLWPLTQPLRVHKTRHLVPVGELTAEVDVFQGKLRGLVVAEIEFESEAKSASFEVPSWIGEEITDDQGYANQSLARFGAPGRPGGESLSG